MLFNEPKLLKCAYTHCRERNVKRFSALQRAEIAEIPSRRRCLATMCPVSVLFNEPKLLKWGYPIAARGYASRFSALQRAEIAEIRKRAA